MDRYRWIEIDRNTYKDTYIPCLSPKYLLFRTIGRFIITGVSTTPSNSSSTLSILQIVLLIERFSARRASLVAANMHIIEAKCRTNVGMMIREGSHIYMV